MANVPGGSTFRLADGTTIGTSIQEAKGRVTAPMVRSALEIAEKDFNQRGVAGGIESLVRIQQMDCFLCVVLQHYAVVYPERSLSSLAIELGAALVALQDEFRCSGISSEK